MPDFEATEDYASRPENGRRPAFGVAVMGTSPDAHRALSVSSCRRPMPAMLEGAALAIGATAAEARSKPTAARSPMRTAPTTRPSPGRCPPASQPAEN